MSFASPTASGADHPEPRPPRWLTQEAPWLRAVPPVILTACAAVRLWSTPASPATWALLLAVIWMLLWRHSAPTRVGLLCAAGELLLTATPATLIGSLAVLVALYNVACRRPTAVAVIGAAGFELAILAVASGAWPGSVDPADIVVLSAGCVGVLLLGTTTQANRRYLEILAERASRLAYEREQHERLVTAAERTRIAREMHDIIAHGLTVVTTVSQGAAASVDTNPEQAKQAMEQVARVAREALKETRKLLGVLREDGPADRHPLPSLDDLPALVDEVRATGLAVVLRTSGDSGELGPAAEATLLRIVQESLTNVINHASGASRVGVHLRFTPGRVQFEINDDGEAGSDVSGDPPSSGRGLTGMRERVMMFGGSLSAGPVPGGWHVCGELNLR